jgi:hypothetical protein
MLRSPHDTSRPARAEEIPPSHKGDSRAALTAELRLKITSRLSAEDSTTYAHFAKICRTEQESAVVALIERQHRTLGRAPTMSELLRGYNAAMPMPLKKDRLAQLVRKLNSRSSTEMELKLTEDRNHKVFEKPFKQLFEQFTRLHGAPPTRSELNKLLRANKIFISGTTQDFMLAEIRRTTPKRSHKKWRLSRRRIGTTWLHIEAAYEEAAVLLKRQGLQRNPAAEEVSFFLKKANHPLSARALEFRMLNKPTRITFSLAPYSDPMPSIIRTCHTRLLATLKRDPNLNELQKAVNALALRPINTDALWTRIARHNASHAREQIKLNPILPSGIYDSDITKTHGELVGSLHRNPTIRELRAGIASRHEGKTLAEDSLYDRLSSLSLPLTSENALKAVTQRAVADSIKLLRLTLGRRPLRAEVVNELARAGVSITEGEFNKTLGTLKKRLSTTERLKLHLGMPNHLADQAKNAFVALSEQQPYPSLEQLRASLGWTTQGVEQLIPIVQERMATRHLPPLMLSGTELGDALKAVNTLLVAALQAQRGASVERLRREVLRHLSAVPGLLAGWDLPPLPPPAALEGRIIQTLPTDELVLHFQITWICLVAFNAPRREVAENLEFDARRIEERWNQRWMMRAASPSPWNPTSNPFAGMAHALLAARSAGRFERVQGTTPDTRTDPRDRLRREIAILASQCGFPPLR